jgi:hypothetical protein
MSLWGAKIVDQIQCQHRGRFCSSGLRVFSAFVEGSCHCLAMTDDDDGYRDLARAQEVADMEEFRDQRLVAKMDCSLWCAACKKPVNGFNLTKNVRRHCFCSTSADGALFDALPDEGLR